MNREKCLKIFDLEEGYTPEQLKSAYRRLAKQYHPDIDKRPTATENFKQLGKVHQYLKDNPVRRPRTQDNYRARSNARPRYSEYDYNEYFARNMRDMDKRHERIMREMYRAMTISKYARIRLDHTFWEGVNYWFAPLNRPETVQNIFLDKADLRYGTVVIDATVYRRQSIIRNFELRLDPEKFPKDKMEFKIPVGYLNISFNIIIW